MKMTIHDKAMLQAIDPQKLEAYLRKHGWEESVTTHHYCTYFDHPDHWHIMVPLYQGLRDYCPRVAEALGILQEAESRSQLEILCDIHGLPEESARLKSLFEALVGDPEKTQPCQRPNRECPDCDMRHSKVCRERVGQAFAELGLRNAECPPAEAGTPEPTGDELEAGK